MNESQQISTFSMCYFFNNFQRIILKKKRNNSSNFCDLFHSKELIFPLKINLGNLHQGNVSPRDRGLFKKHGESFSWFYDSMEANLCHPKSYAVPALFRYLFFSLLPFNNTAPMSPLQRFYAGLIRSRHRVKQLHQCVPGMRQVNSICAAILQM